MSSLTYLSARVKSVSSGDTLVLQGKPRPNGPPAERSLSLAFLNAPKLRREGDEPHAFQSRETLKNLVVSREIQFCVMYSVQLPNGPREFGRVRLQDGTDVGTLLVQKGACRVRQESLNRGEQHPDYVQQLQSAEENAKKEQLGLFHSQLLHLITHHDNPSDMHSFVQQYQGKLLQAVVEHVRSGDSLRIRLLLSSTEHQMITVGVAGVRAPATKKGPSEEESSKAEPFGEEVQLVGVSQSGQTVISKIIHPAGNIAEAILSAGLAKVVDWQSTMVGLEDMGKLRAAEESAKNSRLNVWASFQGKKAQAESSQDAIVTRVISADQVEIRERSGTEKRIQCASIRGLRSSYPKEAALQPEAKEFTRKRLIGKHVKATLISHKPAADGFPAKDLCNVVFGGSNLALELVKQGYATVIRHKKDDDDRSPIYDELMIAEQEAQKTGKGVHSEKEMPSPPRLIEASENATRAKQFLAGFQRSKRIAGVVEHVASGSRFRILVPRDNAMITLVLGGIRAPRASGKQGPGEPYGDEALAFSSRRAMQRDVEIEIDSIDKVGGFIGSLFINKTNDLAIGLLSEGLASVHDYSVEFMNQRGAMYAAEFAAKEARKNVWIDYDPSKDDVADETPVANGHKESSAVSLEPNYVDVAVTDISQGGELSLQIITNRMRELETLMSTLNTNTTQHEKLSAMPKVGDSVVAQFSEDNMWYRAKVKRCDRSKNQVEVVYVDYGNSEVLPLSGLAKTPAAGSFSSLPPQAQQAKLSFLNVPGAGSEYAEEARSFIGQIAGTKQLVANIDHKSGNVVFVTLYDPQNSTSTSESINSELVSAGLAHILPKSKQTWEKAYSSSLTNLQKRQDEAQRLHKGIWEYGDITEE